MEIITNNNLNTVEAITEAINATKDATQKMLLGMLLDAKKKEVELANKLAAKKSTSKFNADEAILKSVFVALRPHIRTDNYDCSAVKAFNAVLQVLPITFSKELQKSLFSTSILHCGKSNMNKAKSTDEALNSYSEAVKQAIRILPSINADEWDSWYYEMKAAKTRADKKNNAGIGTETVQETVQPAKTVIRTSHKKNKK